MTKIAASSPELRKMLAKYSVKELEGAQELLREQVLEEVSQMSKDSIQEMCKMLKFDDFHTYLQSFLTELKGDGLTMRMKKQQK